MACATLAATRVLFNGIGAPLLYVSDRQIGAIVPYGLAGKGSVDVQVEYMGARSDAVTVPVPPSRPGIFTVDGSGLPNRPNCYTPEEYRGRYPACCKSKC